MTEHASLALETHEKQHTILDKLDAWIDNIDNSAIQIIQVTKLELEELKQWCLDRHLMVPDGSQDIFYRGVRLEVK